MIRLPQWQFVEDENHEWHWTCTTDQVRVVCAVSYADRTECVLDAVRRSCKAGCARGGAQQVQLHLSLHESLVRARRAH